MTIGGVELSKELTKRLHLTPSQRLLNVGSATGGSSFQVSQVFILTEDISCETICSISRIMVVKLSESIFQRTWSASVLSKITKIRRI